MAEFSLSIAQNKSVTKACSGHFEMTAGQVLRVKTGLPVTEILDEEVPAGKVWSVNMYMTIVEEDA